MMRRRAATLMVAGVVALTLVGCEGGSDGSSLRPPPATPAPSVSTGAAVSDDQIAGIEKELDQIDALLDDLDAELQSD